MSLGDYVRSIGQERHDDVGALRIRRLEWFVRGGGRVLRRPGASLGSLDEEALLREASEALNALKTLVFN
jgi:hypothetical protein